MPGFEPPSVRPGRIPDDLGSPRVLAYFPNAAMGNSTLQLLVALGVPGAGLAVTPPDRLPGGQGLLVSIPITDPLQYERIEDVCRRNGAEIHRQPGPPAPGVIAP